MFVFCGKSPHKNGSSIEMIIQTGEQETIFRNLLEIAHTVPEELRNDSLAFLILPVQASCPACRKKTIDSIAKNKDLLLANHFIIISANGGRKTIGSYFKEENKELPVIENSLFLDSTNFAYKHNLYTDKPTIYYTSNRKAFKKVAAIPITVKEDLREFFSGYRKPEQ
jgi:hypothetical protein